MKKIRLLLLAVFTTLQYANAQTNTYGSKEYGRLFDLTYDYEIENKIYALSLNNHIMVSEDNGNNWKVLFSNLDGDIEKLRYLPSKQALTFYSKNASEDKIYIYDIKSNSISKTYSLPKQDADSQWIDEYDIWNQNTDIVIAIQAYKIGLSGFAKIQYTNDAGKNWKQIYYTADNFNIFPSKVKIHPNNSSKLFVTLGNGNTDVDGGLLISEDSGTNWTDKIPGIVLNPITFNPTNPNEIYTGTGITFGQQPENIYKSIDGGNTWKIIPFEWNNYLLNDIVSINYNPHNTSEILILEDNEVIKTTDGGKTWTSKVYENASDNVNDYYYGTNASFNPYNPNQTVITSNYYPLFSNDKSENFQRIKTPYFLASGNLHYVKTLEDENFYYSVQSGYVRYNPIKNEETPYDIKGLNISSLGGGKTIIPDYQKSGKLFSFSGGFMGSSLSVTTDHGNNNNTLYNSFKPNLDGLTVTDDSNIIISLSALGLESELIQINYKNINDIITENISTPKENGAIRNIIIDNLNTNNIIISQEGGLYQTKNKGETWEQIVKGLENLKTDSDLIIKIVKNPLKENELLLTSTKGLYFSTNYGHEWVKVYDGIIHNASFSTINNGQIIATIHDSNFSKLTLLYSNDSAKTWKIIDNTILFNPKTSNVYTSTAFNFLNKEAEIFIATPDLGVLKYTLNLDILSISEPEYITSKSTIVYPNPVKDNLNIKISNNQKIDYLDIYNFTGSKIITSNQSNINISSLSKGIYFIKIKLSDGTVESHKFIKS